MNRAGKMVTPWRFDDAADFSEGLAAVAVGAKYGFIRPDGNVAIAVRFDGALSFSGGVAPVRLGEKWGFIDEAGKPVVEPRFDRVSPFRGGLAEVCVAGKCGLLSTRGDVVLEPRYEMCTAVSTKDFDREIEDQRQREVMRDLFQPGAVANVLDERPKDLPTERGRDAVVPEEQAVRVGGDIKMPRLVKKVDPVYPDLARSARVEGVVILDVLIDTQGRVKSAKVLRSVPLLDQAAIEAVRQYVYEPVIVQGRPKNVRFTVTVNFTLPR